MAQSSRGRIGQLIAGLADADRMDEAKEALRALIEAVELVPVSAEEAEDDKPGLAIHLRGMLASLLRLACGLLSSDRPPERKKPRVARGMGTQTLRNLSATISKALIMLRARATAPSPALSCARAEFSTGCCGKRACPNPDSAAFIYAKQRNNRQRA